MRDHAAIVILPDPRFDCIVEPVPLVTIQITSTHPCTYWPSVFEGNDNVSIRSILAPFSSSRDVSSVAEQLGVPAQDPRAARAEGAGSGGVDPGLVFFEAGLEVGVTLVPGGATLGATTGLQVAAVTRQQNSVRVLEVTDLELEHPDRAHSLARER